MFCKFAIFWDIYLQYNIYVHFCNVLLNFVKDRKVLKQGKQTTVDCPELPNGQSEPNDDSHLLILCRTCPTGSV